MKYFVKKLGHTFIPLFRAIGKVTLMVKSSIVWLFKSKLEHAEVIKQSVRIGADSLIVVCLINFFTGMVLALQTGYSSKSLFNEPLYIGTIVGFSIIKELAPVLTAIVVAGRAGAAVTAEIGTMKVTEQLDALHTLGTNPARYILIPRYIAFIVTLPLLTVFADFLGIMGGFVVSLVKLGVPSSVYWNDIFTFMEISNFMHGFLKSIFFALIIATVSFHKGLGTKGGAEGVGKATTESVVASMVLILVFDYFISAAFVFVGLI
jgi:phospholipid/cholesterol/gamma-HCH transport system permease protein